MNCAIDKKKGADNSTLKKEVFQKLDIVEKDNFDFQYKKNFKDNSVVRMEDVRQELYDDINVLDSNVKANVREHLIFLVLQKIKTSNSFLQK